MTFDLNPWALLSAAALYFLLGGIWYAMIFARPWTAALAFTPEVEARAHRQFPLALGAHFVSGTITAFVLANLVLLMKADSAVAGALAGLWIWLGLVLTLNLNSYMFERRPRGVFGINSGFYLVSLCAMGGLLAVWR